MGYVYDDETGLYYLQSRYYNPEWGRFISADNVVSSVGGDVRGYNLFAYCFNNPINLVDYGGNWPYTALGLVDYYNIHNKVQNQCRDNYGLIKEVYVKGPLGNGRLDLYDAVSNSYYEVKSKGAAYTITGNLRKSVQEQMEKYDVATIASKKVPSMKNTTPNRGNKSVSGHFDYGMYDVNYRLEQPGLIVYTINLNQQRAAETTLIALSIGLALVTGGASIPYTAPNWAFAMR